MTFHFEDYPQEYAAMICETTREVEEFSLVLHEAGRRWSSGDSYLRLRYNNNRECYYFNIGKRDPYGKANNRGPVLFWCDFRESDDCDPSSCQNNTQSISFDDMLKCFN